MGFLAKWQATALNATCTVHLSHTPLSQSASDKLGLGEAFNTAYTTATLSCMEIRPQTQIDRRSGAVLTTPLGLLIADPSTQVSTHTRITYSSKVYQVDTLQRDGGLVQVTLKDGSMT